MANVHTPVGPPEPPANERLDSWKEIAAYLKRDVRTVQRWEKQERLPVHRHVHGKLSTLYAYKPELDAWWNNRQPRLEQQEQTMASARRRRLPWLVRGPLALVLGALLLAASLHLLTARSQQIDSLAVLSFANANADPDIEYLSDGIAESIIDKLSQLPNLKLIAPTSVFRYKRRAIDPQAVGRDLDVRAVLTGRVVQRGDKLIIAAELIDASDGSRLWGKQYNRNLADIFAVQEELSKKIPEKLKLRLTSEEKKRLNKCYTESPEAYHAYLKGRYYWNKRTEEGLRKGIEYFEQAIEKDPSYVLAYAGLGDSYNMLGDYNILPSTEAYPRAKAAATKGLEIDDTLAEAHASLAYIRLVYDWDWLDAEKEFKRAIELKPSYATAHHWYSSYLGAMGQLDEAIAEAKRAQELDPLSVIISTNVAWVYYFARQYDQMIEQCWKTLELYPKFVAVHSKFAAVHSNLGWAYVQKRRYPEAIVQFKRARTISGGSPMYVAALGHAYALAGKRDEALKVLHELKELSKEKRVSPGDMALLYTGLGQREQALKWLEKAYEERCGDLAYLKVDPRFDSLRSDPKFRGLLRRIGLPP